MYLGKSLAQILETRPECGQTCALAIREGAEFSQDLGPEVQHVSRKVANSDLPNLTRMRTDVCASNT